MRRAACWHPGSHWPACRAGVVTPGTGIGGATTGGRLIGARDRLIPGYDHAGWMSGGARRPTLRS